MFIIVNSIQQMLRTPVKTVAFLLLVALSASMLAIGINLQFSSEKNLQAFEDTFKTIGTVEQMPDSLPEYHSFESERVSGYGVGYHYDDITVSVLDFKGANYIHTPRHRPYYGAYDENYVLYNDKSPYNDTSIKRAIIEAEPLEDCVPSTPVKLRIKRILCGPADSFYDNVNIGEIWFCDLWNNQPYPMYAGKTYILAIQLSIAYFFPELDSETGIVCASDYSVNNIFASQYDKNGNRIPDELMTGEISEWEEVTDGFYDTLRGQRWLELVKGFDRLNKTIPVMPVDTTCLLMDFYNGESNIIDGRDIDEEEYKSGSKVCLIQQRFAELNGVKVGDSLPLPLYYADYGRDVHDIFPFDFLGIGMNRLNAQGKMYPVFENEEYTIVGIYTPGPESGKNMVIIPAVSMEHSDENNIVYWGPMTVHNTTFEIPNGTIDEFMKAWDGEGFSQLDVHLYDKGYSQLKDGLDRMRVISTILLSVGGGTMILILIFFTFLFIVKNKKRTAVERSLGLSKGTCALSLFSAMTPLTVLGIASGSTLGYFICGFIAKMAMVFGNEDAFDLMYSNGVNQADKIEQVEISLVGSEMLIAIACGALVISILIISVGVWRNLRHEPLALLCTREDE